MYGYFKPKDSRLTVDEQRIFNAYYCRVCYCLRILGGQPARFFTTFDMAVYSLLLNIAQKKERPQYHVCEKISTKVMHEYDKDEIGKRLANMSIIMFGEKIRDDRIDGNHFRANGMDLMFRKTVAHACLAEPQMAYIARKGTDLINQLQSDHEELIKILEAYGNMVAEMFLCIDDLDERFLRLYRSIATWTFYIDMLYDYNKDYRKNSYNGFRVDGLSTLQECFNLHYVDFIRTNQKIIRELRETIKDVDDGSAEWKILYKIVDTALNSAAIPVLSTRSERWKMSLEYLKRNVHCIPLRSNFR